MKRIPSGSVDMILTDLPYGTTACSWDNIIPFDEMWEQYERIIKDNGAIVLTASQPFTSALLMSNPKLFKHEWIWEKNRASNFMGAKYAPLKYHENILVFGKGKIKYNPQKYDVLEVDEIIEIAKSGKGKMAALMKSNELDKYGVVDRRKSIIDPLSNKELVGIKINRTRKKDDGTRFPKSIIKSNNSTNNIHPTQKPLELFEYLINSYSDKGDIIVDSCMGSGTTAIACHNTMRNYIGFEMDKTYYEQSLERIKIATRQTSIFDYL